MQPNRENAGFHDWYRRNPRRLAGGWYRRATVLQLLAEAYSAGYHFGRAEPLIPLRPVADDGSDKVRTG